VAAYHDHLNPLMAPRSVLSLLVGLKVTVRVFAPNADWQWLKDICNILDRNSPPSVDKQAKLRTMQEIYVAAIKQLGQLRQMPLEGRSLLCAYRDTLMVGIATARPLRRQNLTDLRIGTHLIRRGGTWHIEVPHYEVKNRRYPLEFDLPPELVPYLDFYIEKVRTRFLRDDARDHLWLSCNGTAMAPGSIHHCVCLRTEEMLGVRINPHALRYCAASSLALESPEFARAAAPLLGHTSFATTEQHYVQARQIDASRKLNDVLSKVRQSLKE